MDLSERPEQLTRRHPWETSRQRFFASILAEAPAPTGALRILDAGAGDGWFCSQALTQAPAGSTATCWDAFYSPEDLQSLRESAAPGVSFTAEQPDERFDLIFLLDVLEHVEDDRPFLTRLVEQNLAPGGQLMFSVPAWPQLFSQHDVALKHFRRYTPADAREVLQDCGLRITRSGGLFHSLMLPRVIQCASERFAKGNNGAPQETSEHDLGWQHGALLSGVIDGALAIDNAVSRELSRRGVDAPGLSWWALCEHRA